MGSLLGLGAGHDEEPARLRRREPFEAFGGRVVIKVGDGDEIVIMLAVPADDYIGRSRGKLGNAPIGVGMNDPFVPVSPDRAWLVLRSGGCERREGHGCGRPISEDDMVCGNHRARIKACGLLKQVANGARASTKRNYGERSW